MEVMESEQLLLEYSKGRRDFSNIYLKNCRIYNKDLPYINLYNSNLQGSVMVGCNLRRANFTRANLSNSILRHSYLTHADFTKTNLRGSTISQTDLRDACLWDAKVQGVLWPTPTMVLLAKWGGLSNKLTKLAMAYDASCHPRPSRFARWAKGGPCPYYNTDIERAVNFIQKRELWDSRAKAPTANALFRAIIKECCDLS